MFTVCLNYLPNYIQVTCLYHRGQHLAPQAEFIFWYFQELWWRALISVFWHQKNLVMW